MTYSTPIRVAGYRAGPLPCRPPAPPPGRFGFSPSANLIPGIAPSKKKSSARVFPHRSLIVPFWIVPRVTVSMVPPRIATTPGCGCAASVMSAADARRRTKIEKRCGFTASSARDDITRRARGGRRASIVVYQRLCGLCDLCVDRSIPFRRRRSTGRVEEVLIEPFEVVLHRRAMALRLARSVADAAEPLVDDQFHRHVLILQTLI